MKMKWQQKKGKNSSDNSVEEVITNDGRKNSVKKVESQRSGDTYQSITVANGNRCVLYIGHLSCVKAACVFYWLRGFVS